MGNRTMVKSIGVLSLGKVLGAIYAVMGLIVGIFFALFSIVLSSAASGLTSGPGFQGFGLGFGIAGLIFLPILYAGFGFVFGMLTAFVYNIVAGWIGGVELELE